MSQPDLATPSAAPWLSALARAFGAASEALGVESLLLALFGRRVRLRFAGSALRERMLPALAHLVLPEDGRPTDLTINLWDGASEERAPPPPPRASYGRRGEIRHAFTDFPLEVSFQIETGTLEVFAPPFKLAYCWVRDVARWPLWQRAAPLRTTLGHFARTAAGQLVHGAGVGTADGAVLLSAAGGSGKSTTALACLHSSLLYLGDDYVFLSQQPRQQTRTLFSIYATAKLRPDGISRLAEPDRFSWQRESGEDKSLLFLHPCWRDRLALRLPLRALLIPSLSAQAMTRLRPASTREALHALAPTTLFQLAGSDPAVFKALAELLRGVPAYRLELGPRPEDAAAAIRELLSSRAEEARYAAQ